MRPGRQVTDRLIFSDVPAYILSTTGVVRHKWTIYQWRKNGLLSYSNRQVKLKAEKICRQWFTRKSWVDEFIRELEL